QGPEAGGLGRRDDRLEQGSADALAAGPGRHLDALPRAAAVYAARRLGCLRDPPQHGTGLAAARHEPAIGAVGPIEVVPVWRVTLEGRVAGRDALGVDLAHGRPIGGQHRLDEHAAREGPRGERPAPPTTPRT